MKIEFANIDIPYMEFLIHDIVSEADRDKIVAAAKYAITLTAVWYGTELLCVYALIPTTLLSDQAYIWMFWTEAITRHKLVFARRAKRLTKELLGRYSTIVGHCTRPESQPWLISVGATFRSPTEFVISR